MSHQAEVVHEEEEEEETAPFWMISFSDMMTLLLTFFIMLYTISTLNATKAQAVSNSMQRQFGYRANMYMVPAGARFESGSNELRDKKSGGEPIIKQLPQFNPRLSHELVSHGLVLFDFGSDELSEANRKALETIVSSLENMQKIELRGRASPDEKKAPFASDLMDLAYSRAHVVRTYLINMGIKPSRIEIKLLDPTVPLEKSAFSTIEGINSSVEISTIVDRT